MKVSWKPGMGDWADEIMTELYHDWNSQNPGGPSRAIQILLDMGARALRAVQRETAEECCKLADQADLAHRAASDAIRERFGLKERMTLWELADVVKVWDKKASDMIRQWAREKAREMRADIQAMEYAQDRYYYGARIQEGLDLEMLGVPEDE